MLQMCQACLATPWPLGLRSCMGPVRPGGMCLRDMDNAMPGRAALEAVVSPVEEAALFFVARGDGTHQFSATLDEHDAAVDRYQGGGGQ